MSRVPRRVLASSLVLALAAISPALVGASSATGDEPDTHAIDVPGLERPVDITVDDWGISHINAENTDDLFHAQGFVAARDRLFQIDTWRRSGLGELSDVLGADYVEQDAASRLFLYRDDIEAEWESYAPEARAIATEYAAGINAYIDWLADNPDALPAEFQELGYEPAHWEPEDVVRIRSHAIASNISQELGRAQITCADGIEASKYLRKLEPAHTPEIPEGLDPCSIPDDVLDTYDLATAGVTFVDGEMERTDPTADAIHDAGAGSNSWVLGPERTESERPLLASDPHRATDTAPANRYLVHLSAPGIDVIGAGEPWSPGVSLGHNGNVAFGLTNIPADQEDLYVYELDPDDPTRYRYGDGWESFETVEENIPVAGEDHVATTLQFTRHGPVIKMDEENDRAYAVRTVWTEPGTSPYLGALSFQQATDFDEFEESLTDWKTPASNLTYADAEGNIGWAAAGLVPHRVGDGYDGLLPVPGDGRYEWDGFHGSDELPRILNPDDGYFASGNEYNFPEDYEVMPTYEWHEEYRQLRMEEVLSIAEDATVQDTLDLQTDQKSTFATELLPYLDELTSDDPATQQALELLRDHDGVADEESSAAVLFEVWSMLVLRDAWVETVLPGGTDNPIFFTLPDVRVMMDSFEDPEEWFGPGGEETRDALLLGTLGPAFQMVVETVGPDPADWRWGDLHTQTFQHPLGDTIGPVPRGGTYHTVQVSFYHPLTFQQLVGPVFRMAVDVGDWDASRTIIAPGQSGDPTSPHYDDLHELWADDGTFPLVYTPEAIEEHASEHLVLRPGQS